MSSLGVWRGGGYNSWTPLSPSDVWDPFDFGFGVEKSWGRGPDDDVSALAHAHVDWRETDNAHVFRADLPGLLISSLPLLLPATCFPCFL